MRCKQFSCYQTLMNCPELTVHENMRRILVFVNSAKICQAVKIDIYEPIYNKNWKSRLVNMIHDPLLAKTGWKFPPAVVQRGQWSGWTADTWPLLRDHGRRLPPCTLELTLTISAAWPGPALSCVTRCHAVSRGHSVSKHFQTAGPRGKAEEWRRREVTLARNNSKIMRSCHSARHSSSARCRLSGAKYMWTLQLISADVATTVVLAPGRWSCQRTLAKFHSARRRPLKKMLSLLLKTPTSTFTIKNLMKTLLC